MWGNSAAGTVCGGDGNQAGADFIKLLLINMDGKENQSIIGQYDEDIIMMMYDDVVIKRKSELMSQEFSLL